MIPILIVTALNIFLWIIMLVRFRKLFNTEKIIEKTRRQLDQLETQLNANASRDIDLVNATIRNLRQMNSIAKENIDALDKKLGLVKENESRRDGVKVFSEKLWDYKAPSKPVAEPAIAVNPYATLNPYGNQVSKAAVPNVEHVESKNTDQKSMIRHMYNQGKSIADIAEELSCSEMEVQFTIDLG
ncbi:MAG: hypothetical protein MJ176_01035 [Treponema sp.]|nr:hypothetical protein [Treponema sp.]